jgi:putative OPT family oligopeptide transporter
MALVVGGMICIAAANAGATSQDLKTGYLVGATPRYQQISLFIGAIVSSLAIGFTVKILDTPTAQQLAQGITHAIGTDRYSAPQATLMATLIKGILSFNLDWQFVIVGVFIALVMELCGIKALSFAIGIYLPLSTTLPIFIGGAIRGIVDRQLKKRHSADLEEEEDLRKGNLFATRPRSRRCDHGSVSSDPFCKHIDLCRTGENQPGTWVKRMDGIRWLLSVG